MKTSNTQNNSQARQLKQTAPATPLTASAGIAVLILILLLIGDQAHAQGTVRAWGMGGANTALSRGLGAVDYNPANLAFSEGTSVGLAAAALDVKNNAISLDRYNEITGSHLDHAAKTALMSDIPEDGFRLDADARASVLGVQTGNFAFSFNATGSGRGNLDKDYFDLVLFGNQLGKTVDFSNTWGEGYAVGSATVSYGQIVMDNELGRLSVGLNARYLQGIYEMHVEEAYGSLSTSMTEISGEAYVSTLSSDGGQGYGVDLGVGWQTPGGWTLGLALDNVFTRINWDGNVEINEFRVTASDINILNEDLDASVADNDTTFAGLAYQTELPRKLRLGATRQVGAMAVAVDYVQGFDDRGTTSKTPQFNAGFELWSAGNVQPRFGATTGGTIGSGVSAGLGLRLGPWNIDLAAVSRGGLNPNQTKGVGFAAGSTLIF
jgi:hypothetical protein|nr:DUF5723 family protein [Candidatus Krumholzibacteria bacterium]